MMTVITILARKRQVGEMYYINDNGDIAEIIERDYRKNLVKIAVNGVLIDEWRTYDSFVQEFKRAGIEK